MSVNGIVTNKMNETINTEYSEINSNSNSNSNKNYGTNQSSANGVTDWGRESKVSFLNVLFVGLVFFFSPFIVIYFWACNTHYGGLLFAPLIELYNGEWTIAALFNWFINLLPTPTWQGFALYFTWLTFHVLAYCYFPSKIGYGQETPAGHILPYRVNGLAIWFLTHILFFVFTLVIPVFRGDIIANNWGGLLVATNVYGYFLTFFSYFKAHYLPSHPEDRKFSGNWLYDLVMGIELNPRIGVLDFKLFHNGRPGITAWTLINISFAFAQFYKYGYVTNSMILVNVLHAIYVVDFFYNEDWYLRTIDIAHDHFGYYLAWGDSVWLPFMYTLQCVYLLQDPVNLDWISFSILTTIGLGGYAIFRECNNQKDIIRKNKGKGIIWGKPAKVIEAQYTTADGQVHTSYLLYSGYWGFARHFNYFGDLMMCFAFCASCGTRSLLPYFYFFYMIALLVHRTYRDQNRCKGKYGKYWDEYCEKVPYKIVPYIF